MVTIRGQGRHPLIYKKQILDSGNARPGDLCAVYTSAKMLVGYGLWNPSSELSLRLLFNDQAYPDDSVWRMRIASAVRLRIRLLNISEASDACRLVHAEADGLSGLIADRFNDTISLETFSLGMYQRARRLAELLCEETGALHWTVRPSPHFLAQEGYDLPSFSSADCPRQVEIREYGTRFRVEPQGGHKTGFFCDQRENRRRLADFCRGRNVADICCYTGGFSIQAKKLGEANEVTGIDLDEGPLQTAKTNANLNQCRIRFVQADAFTWMRDLLQTDRRFDVVVLDPPKLIRTRAELEEGTRRHFDLNRLAMRLVAPGGLLLTCSCAGLLPETEFLKLLASAARQSGDEYAVHPESGRSLHRSRRMRLIGKSGAAPDHPVASDCPEGEYLKAAWVVLD